MIGLNIDDNDDSLKWNKGLDLDMQQTQQYVYEMRSLLFSSIMQHLIEIMQQFNLSFKVKIKAILTISVLFCYFSRK